jgi:hypothetical protein
MAYPSGSPKSKSNTAIGTPGGPSWASWLALFDGTVKGGDPATIEEITTCDDEGWVRLVDHPDLKIDSFIDTAYDSTFTQFWIARRVF